MQTFNNFLIYIYVIEQIFLILHTTLKLDPERKQIIGDSMLFKQ